MFQSNRGKEGEKTAVWTIPATGPGEATLLKRFPVSVGNLRWEASGIVVSASVYLDEEDPLKGTATRDDKKVEGGLNAHLFKRLPVREWDRWLGAKFAHPFYQPLTRLKDGSYVAEGAAVDGLAKVATACPSGAFGGSEDWSVSPTSGAVALSARPPLAADEAWTTNRHIYLKESFSSVETMCLTEANPGFDFSPSFSPDGSKLAWLTMAGAQYEADAVGVKLYDVATKATTDLIAADVDFAYSPQSLTWSGDGKTIYFTADIRARQRLCAIDVASKAIKILGSDTDGSITIHDEINGGLLVSCESFTSPPELYRCSRDGTNLEQLTFFNKEKLAAVDLGVAEDISFRNQRPGRESPDGADIQAWLLKPANFDMKKKYPLAVVIHGGPQGSVSDRWHYRWNLQSYGSAGFAVLAVNFRGSTGMGHAYCRDISGDWSIGPDDTVAGVRHCLEAYDWLDASRVAGLGASYGGFSVNYLNGHAPEGMFKCLVNHDGVFDFRSGYWSTEELFFKEKELGGTPYAPESQLPTSMYQTTSPSAAVDKWKTPTLVIHGDKDFRLVTSEALATFTALQRQGIESEFLFFPDENHWVLNPQNSLVWHNTVLSWIRKYTA